VGTTKFLPITNSRAPENRRLGMASIVY
jgi:hypothetical protein